MSEEAKKESDIPRGMTGSLGITTVFYALIAISVIRLFGVKSAGTQLSPIASAYGLIFGDKAQHVVNIARNNNDVFYSAPLHIVALQTAQEAFGDSPQRI